MIELQNGGAYLVRGRDVVPDGPEAADRIRSLTGKTPDQREAARNTIAYRILEAHNTSGNMEQLKIKFDKMISHDITFVGIIQTARASGLEKFPIPYVLTNCHNSLCAVGGTINEDDHMFGLSCAKRYGGAYVPPHQAVIHQYAREMMSGGGKMILGSDSHTRYGALGTMAMGEGGPELVKQLLNRTYDIPMPGVVGVYLTGEPVPGVGPQDIALAIIGAVFEKGYVKNKVMEFVGPGVSSLSADYRIGVDVMTTETTCLSSIWRTDSIIRDYYEEHGRPEEYRELNPGEIAYYDGMITVELDKIRPMIAMPFHPSNVYTIEECNANLEDILDDVEKRAQVSLDGKVDFHLKNKIHNGKLLVDQGIIAGCAGGGFENICDAADILRGQYIGCDDFTLSIYPASAPIYTELARNGVLADLMETGAVVKTAFCGPCFGAGDTPANGDLSIRHSTRNFPNREGSKVQNGQIASVALMDARSIAATAANKGYLTPATEFAGEYRKPLYHFDSNIYAHRVFDSHGKADPSVPVRFGPNIKDWPSMSALPQNLILKVVGEGQLFLGGLMVMLMSIILGMGVPGVAAYVIVYAVAVPVLRGVGATEMAANMFCLIYACLSNITPPVAMSSYVASGIADSDMTKTSLIAIKLGIAGFIVPFFFLDNPVLLYGSTEGVAVGTTVYAFLTACVGVLALASGLAGLPMGEEAGRERALRLFCRGLLVTAGILFVSPSLATDAAAIGLIVLQALLERLFLRRAAPASAA